MFSLVKLENRYWMHPLHFQRASSTLNHVYEKITHEKYRKISRREVK